MDADRGPARRRFLTRNDVEDAHAAGRSIRLTGRDVLTHEAAQRARDLGVVVEKESSAPWSRSDASGPSSVPADKDRLRAAVRSAVIAELGSEPPTLDAVIDKVLRERG